ncbi:MAG: hypothetical protein AVDCRST_MAG19-700 [uncultured Thermomicrobiales bacterium]|uniref:Solute-binding protein family 5 domain-containing protein n=1 Tax=uncultured Thermomicrobiales bacterium TaxID=1645740 RepID=A0A6J4UIF9_9BACT|nr:MAG: hypothetical protein AVDCRST_MAG19-700 [uncultured Thermomicrobiales bacterium]
MIDPAAGGPRATGRRAKTTPEARSVDDLVRARRAGRIGRRELIQRAALLGVAAPVLGVVLTATSDAAPGRVRPAVQYPPAEAATPITGATGTVPASGPTYPPGRPVDGGTVVIGMPREPDTLHPWLTQSLAGFDVLEGVMDGLLRYDAEQRLQPALAEDYAISDDGLTYTFRLRRDARFHNGDLFTADDFVAAWETKLDRAFGPTPTLGWDKIADVASPDDRTLVVTTEEPFAPFLSSVGVTFLCPASALTDGLDAFAETFGRTPVGTGPFRVAGWDTGSRIGLVRFDDYWGDGSRLDRVVFSVLPELDDRLEALAAGEVQLLGGAGALTADEVERALPIPGITILEHPTQSWQHLDLKQIGFLRETPVRQALDHATPKRRIVDELLRGRAVPAFADQAPGTWAHHPTLEPRPDDPDAAAALLDAAGLLVGGDGVRRRDGEPFAMELWGVDDDPLGRRIVELIAAEWNAIGVATTPRFGDAATLWGPMGYQFSDRMTACLYTWTNANDPDNTFYWNSSQIPSSPTAAGGNLPAFFHPYRFQAAIDALTSRAAAESDQETRRELYRQTQELLRREVPVIFLYWEQAFPAAAENLGGFWPSAFNQLLWNAHSWYLTEPDAGTPAATPVPPRPPATPTR